MKTREVALTTVFYGCQHCDYEAQDARDVEQHEKTHNQATCKHEQMKYHLNGQDDCDGCCEIEVEARCPDCLLHVETGVDRYNQELCKAIFKLVRGEEVVVAKSQERKKLEGQWVTMQCQFEAKYGREMNAVEIKMFKPANL